MKRPLFLAAAFLLAIPASAAADTPDGNPSPETAPASVDAVTDDGDMIIPPARRETSSFQQPADFGRQVRLTLYMLLLMGGGGAMLVWWQRRRKAPGGNVFSRPGQIEICETRPIGSRQYLAIVRCGERRLLLGIGPERIDHLCFLDPESGAAEDTIQDLPNPADFRRIFKK